MTLYSLRLPWALCLLFSIATVFGKPLDFVIPTQNRFAILFEDESSGDYEDYGYRPQLIGETEGGSCILDVNKDLPKKNEPLLLTRGKSGDTSLLLPEAEGKRGVIALREGEEIIISCPGNKNSIEGTKEAVSRAVCRAGTTLNINGRDWNAEALDCTSRPAASIKITKKSCANGKGVIVELGFESNGWTKMVESCHNIAQSETYYSVHTINGAKLAGKVFRRSGRPGFSRGDKSLFLGFNPEAAYTRKNQETVFTKSLGAKQAQTILDQKTGTFLARGHLAPDADFLLSPHQMLTYFYVNVGPQWQSINGGNWVRIEEATRKAATKLGADLEVVTGTLGTLRLPAQKGERELFLHENRLPVPEFFWKVLRNTQDDSCIAFVASNNPFATKAPRQICSDVCAKNSWPEYKNDIFKGYIYCCEYAEIKKAVPDMPNLNCKSVLRG